MLVRCSSLGKIMTNARSKKEVLSQTAKSYVKQTLLEDEFGIKNEFWSRYTDKGNEVEQKSIDLCNDVLDFGFMYKNEERFTNKYITGEPDIITDVVVDIKSSWDASTFPLFEDKLPNKDYFYQVQGYMWLTGKRKAYIAYCLVDTPQQIVEDEIRREHWKQQKIDECLEVRDYVQSKHQFSHIPKDNRVKLFRVDYDKEVIQAIKTRIEACREYYEELKEKLTINVEQ